MSFEINFAFIWPTMNKMLNDFEVDWCSTKKKKEKQFLGRQKKSGKRNTHESKKKKRLMSI